MKENDLLMGGFAQASLEGFSEAQLDQFEALTVQADIDIYNWVMGKEPIPDEFNTEVMAALVAYKNKL